MNSRTIPQTSTFTICHEKCNPENWTVKDIMFFADFLDTGNMMYAAELARLGVALIVSEHHAPKGGEFEPIGWAEPGKWIDGVSTEIEEAVTFAGDEDVTPLCRIYSGKPEYFARIPYGDNPEGEFSHYEYEMFENKKDAEQRVQDVYEKSEAM